MTQYIHDVIGEQLRVAKQYLAQTESFLLTNQSERFAKEVAKVARETARLSEEWDQGPDNKIGKT